MKSYTSLEQSKKKIILINNKVMTQEEKASRYDEAIEKAKSWYVDAQIDFKKSLETLFPVLKESEDDKIRKEIIDFIYDKTDTYELREKSNSWLSWLEKQGEKSKPININKMVTKYSQTKDGDFGLPVNCQIRAYRQGINDTISTLNLEKQGEHKSIDKVEPKFHEGDQVIVSTTNGG